MSVRQGNKVIAGHINYHPDLLDHKWADHILNDVSWLRADTFSWQDGGVYQAAYQHLADDIDGKTLQSETISGTTIQFYLVDDGHKICPASEESNVVAIYNATGVAWYYIIDTTNQRFKLPRTKFGFTGLRGTVGNYVAPGLPNITGYMNGVVSHSGNTSTGGALSHSDTADLSYTGGGSAAHYLRRNNLNLNASSSSSIYGASSTVQPQATQMYLYFYVGNFTQTAIENTAGITTETLNDKADLSLVATKVDKGHEVIAYQAPSSSNNYTWYRRYSDGWIEQGGFVWTPTDQATTITLLVAMPDNNYNVLFTRYFDSQPGSSGCDRNGFSVWGKTTTKFNCWAKWGGSTGLTWQVTGRVA